MNIVMYHYIRKQSVRHGQLNYLRDHEFEKQLTFFEQNGGIVRIPSANSTGSETIKAEGSFLLSFDDGLIDHLNIAKKLKARGLLGIFGITTKTVFEDFTPTTHLLHRLFAHNDPEVIYANCNEYEKEMIDVFSKKKLLDASVYRLHREDSSFKLKLKTFVNYYSNRKAARGLVEKLCQRLGVEISQDGLFLKKADIELIVKMGHLVIAHGHTHQNLRTLDKKDWQFEIKKSLEIIRYLGGDSSYYMFPFGGRKSFHDEHLNFLRDCGVINAFTVDNLPAEDFLASPNLEIPRLDCKLYRTLGG